MSFLQSKSILSAVFQYYLYNNRQSNVKFKNLKSFRNIFTRRDPMEKRRITFIYNRNFRRVFL